MVLANFTIRVIIVDMRRTLPSISSQAPVKLCYSFREAYIMTAQPTEFKPFAASLPSPIVVVHSAALRYGAASAITAAITLLRLSLNRYLNDKSVFSFYFAWVVLAAWYLGLGPSLLNIISGAAIASYYFARARIV